MHVELFAHPQSAFVFVFAAIFLIGEVVRLTTWQCGVPRGHRDFVTVEAAQEAVTKAGYVVATSSDTQRFEEHVLLAD